MKNGFYNYFISLFVVFRGCQTYRLFDYSCS